MQSKELAEYRLNLAKWHLEMADKMYNSSLWAPCGHSAQLCVENSAKAVISLYRTPPKLHELEAVLIDISVELEEQKSEEVRRLADCVRKMGLREHILTNYGDELELKTPGEIYTRHRAKRALEVAKESFKIAQYFISAIK